MPLDASCPYCCLIIHGGWAGCNALKGEIPLKEASDPDYGRYHRLSHDAYCVQHDER